jgi:hypothetical protein
MTRKKLLQSANREPRFGVVFAVPVIFLRQLSALQPALLSRTSHRPSWKRRMARRAIFFMLQTQFLEQLNNRWSCSERDHLYVMRLQQVAK